jgi:hypothetical protein
VELNKYLFNHRREVLENF